VKRSTDRYLTTHVGSMIRPPKIAEYVEALAAGQTIDQPDFEAELRAGVHEVVHRQVEAGVDMVSDGEFSKTNWLAYFKHRVSGFETRMQPLRSPCFLGAERDGCFSEFYDQTITWFQRGQPFPHMVCVGPVKYSEAGRAAIERDIANLKCALARVQVEEAFLPVVAPCSMGVAYWNEY
jgi:5-methyltetrahydropteroyltriglutamate--homocysteine methyltransferase